MPLSCRCKVELSDAPQGLLPHFLWPPCLQRPSFSEMGHGLPTALTPKHFTENQGHLDGLRENREHHGPACSREGDMTATGSLALNICLSKARLQFTRSDQGHGQGST